MTESSVARTGKVDHYLEGPEKRRFEFTFLFRVAWEFFTAFRKLHFVGPCVTIFGSARIGEDSPYYALGKEMGYAVAEMGFGVMTGGGPGLMEAANRGAKEAGGRSLACTIQLPMEIEVNEYVDRSVEFKYFFVRKVLLLKYSYAFVVLPGGYGTLDEIFEVLTLLQTNKIKNFPVVLMGKTYWQGLYDYIHTMVESGTISQDDLDRILFTDSVDEAFAHLQKYAVNGFRLQAKKMLKPHRIFAEEK